MVWSRISFLISQKICRATHHFCKLHCQSASSICMSNHDPENFFICMLNFIPEIVLSTTSTSTFQTFRSVASICKLNFNISDFPTCSFDLQLDPRPFRLFYSAASMCNLNLGSGNSTLTFQLCNFDLQIEP